VANPQNQTPASVGAGKRASAKTSGAKAAKTVETVEVKRASGKPSESKAVETKAAETKAAETKTASSKSTASTAPKAAKASQSTEATGQKITFTLPVEQVISAYVAVSNIPITVARRVIPAKNGIPLYVGVGALAVVGAVEWPVAAAAGAGIAVLRRWGPLRASQNGEGEATGKAENTQVK
jgi:ribosomal protein S25